MSRDLLIILNPREIDECLASYAELEIDRLWISYFSEAQIAAVWESDVMPKTKRYRNLMVTSDDGVVRQHVIDTVSALLEEHPVVSGYCNFSAVDFRVNLSRSPLGPQPAESAYDPPMLAEVMEWTSPIYPTYFVGMSVTGMSRKMWLEFPFRVTEHLGQSDFHLSKRLHAADVPMVGARDAFCWHVKEVWNTMDREPRKRLLVGERNPTIRLEHHR